MAKTVKLPVIGETRTAYVGVGVGVLAVILGVAYYRAHRASSASSATAAAAPASATGSIDPVTGDVAGSAQDQADLAALQAAGYGGESGYYGDGYGYSYGGGGGGLLGGGTSSSTPNSGPGTFTSNSYWIAYCEEQIIGYSAGQIQSALVEALAGGKLTSAQFTIWQTALAVGGEPPSPPATPPAPPASGGNPPPPGGGPNPPPAKISGEVSDLHVTGHTATSADIAWSPVAGADGYEVKVMHVDELVESESVTGSSARISGLKPKTRYRFDVRAKPGKQSSVTYVTTS